MTVTRHSGGRRSLDPLSPGEHARLQGLFIEAAERDQNFVRTGGQLYYAVDTNVVEFIVDPRSKALPSSVDHNRRSGFAAIFADDPIEPAHVLAQALADFLVEELSPSTPLLVPPPLDAQIFRWQQVITRSIANEIEPGVSARADRLRKELNASTTLTAKAEKVAAQLLQLTLLRRGTQTLERLRDLFDRKRLVIVAASRDALREPLWDAVAPIDIDAGHEWLRAIYETNTWRRELLLLASNRVGARSVDQKSEALAHLERWNGRLARPRGPNTVSARIIFLTGDNSLLERPSSPGSGRQATTKDEFLWKHVRHPRTFLSSLPLLKDSHASTSITNFHDEGQATPIQTIESHFMDLWARWQPTAPQDKQDSIAQEIQDRWHQLLSATVLRYKFPTAKSDELEDWQKLSQEDIEKWQESLKSEIDDRVSNFWEQCFYFATQGLVVFGRSADYNPNPRNGPPIFLESWTSTANFVDGLLSWTTPARFDVGNYTDGIEKLEKELKNGVGGEEDYRYGYYLAHAALFAGRGDWLIAAKVAGHARGKVHEGETSPGRGNGREALYLEAFSLRHAARRLEDLAHLESLIDRAADIAGKELEFAKTHNLPEPDCVSIRFEVERLAIRLSRWLFCNFHSSDVSNGERAESLVDLAADVLRLLGVVEERAEAARTAIEPGAKAEDRRRLEILYKLQIRLLVNALGISFYGKGDSPLTLDEERELVRKADAFREAPRAEILSRDNHAFSAFGEAVLWCAKVRVADSTKERDAAKREVLAHLSDERLKALATFPYDLGERGRLRVMRETALAIE